MRDKQESGKEESANGMWEISNIMIYLRIAHSPLWFEQLAVYVREERQGGEPVCQDMEHYAERLLS